MMNNWITDCIDGTEKEAINNNEAYGNEKDVARRGKKQMRKVGRDLDSFTAKN